MTKILLSGGGGYVESGIGEEGYVAWYRWKDGTLGQRHWFLITSLFLWEDAGSITRGLPASSCFFSIYLHLSENISVWIPRSRRSRCATRTASGIAPIPSCNVAPSAIKLATCCPICNCVSVDILYCCDQCSISKSQRDHRRVRVSVQQAHNV